MKKIYCLLLILSSALVFSQAKMEIKDSKKNFGFVKKGELVKVEYDITNKGNQPLLITDVEISCSCTTVDYPKQPVAPGQSVKVIVNFDTKTVYDRQDRTVNLVSNDPKGPHKLRYKGVVLTK
jgi:hypothetical protein